MNAELVMNLWVIYDASTELVYALAGRAYCVSGTDAEKLSVLRRLSATDYVTAKRLRVPARFHVVSEDEGTLESVTFLNAIRDFGDDLFAEVFESVASELPTVPDFSTPDHRMIRQKLPGNPLTVVTSLYEDEDGSVRPIITDEDRQWIVQREKARGRGLPGM